MPRRFEQISETWLEAPAAAIGFTEAELVDAFDAVERLSAAPVSTNGTREGCVA